MPYDVIISGAGPVGLFLAAELALKKCSVLILEKEADPRSVFKQAPFGIRGLSAPTTQALERRGLLSQLQGPQRIKNPHMNRAPSARRQVGHFAGIPFHESEVDCAQWKYRLPGAPAPSLMAEMQELEDVLARRAETLGVTIRRAEPTSGVQQTADTVVVQAGGNAYTGKWLVGCDGSRSVVRKVCGFEFAGTEPEFTGYSTRVDLAEPEKLGTGRQLTARGMYLQSQPGYLILQEFDGGARHQSQEPLTREQVQQVLRRVSGIDVEVTALHEGATWTDRARQATTYRQGRVLLAGDAAHIHAPLGGQGLNLGMGDAMNLGWKLAAVVRHAAPSALLDTYESERHPIGAKVLDWSRAQVVVMRPDPAARALYAILRDVLDTRDGATYFAARVWGVLTRYNLGDSHPLVGRSAPDFEFEDGTKLAEKMHEARWMLLDFTDHAALQSLAQNCGDAVQYLGQRVRDALGLQVVLIRPDGIIAQAFEGTPDAQFIRDAVGVSRPPTTKAP